MDIFIFLEIFSSEGGIQSYVQDVLQAYLSLTPSRGGKVFLLRDGVGVNNPLEGKSLEFHYLKTNSARQDRLSLAYLLLKSLIKGKAKQVYCGHINLAALIASLCLPLGIPYTVLTYGKEVWQPLPLFKRLALTQAKEIWTISRYSRDRLCTANGINPQQVKIIPCVVDGDRFSPGAKSSLLLDKYNLRDSKVIMTVARLWSGDIYKGVDVTIRALPLILPYVPNLKYLVIGRGDDQPRLARLAQDLGVAKQVIFAGFIPATELPDYYRLADAYIMPSQEGFGIVYLEALATGIPVVAGDSDGSADPLQDGLLGWRVPYRDPQAVAKACLEVLQGGDRRCQSEWLREQTLAKYSLSTLSKLLP
ncbi:MAG: glycosyltransferase family 1 protein [Gloeocapsa sp. DLM2.Bin57]|nr:MAG: glycosyltransferase family 1 protein [Gloeocapsa sp. DLM2.Bin57]